jgi:phospholipase C
MGTPTRGLTRRRFLGTAAAGAAGLGLLPASMRQVLAATPERTGSLRDVKHIMFVLQENRSFDHYFGTLPGVRGFSDRTAIRLSTGRSAFFQPDALNPDGYELPFHLDTTTTSAAALTDTSHAWPVQHQSWNGGRMDNWLPAHRAADGAAGPLVMGYYTRADIPFHYALADAFTVCDNYHCSVLGPSNPNHIVAVSGTIDPAGLGGGPVVSNAQPNGLFTFPTYYERLQAAGITWRDYAPSTFGGELPFLFAQFANAAPGSPLYENGVRGHPLSELKDDIINDRLPQFSRIESFFPPEVDEHPPSLPAEGASFLFDVLDALAANPDVWAKTVLFITYDENDGLFDHVPPPTAPEGTPGEWVTATPLPADAGGISGPIGLGFRVPMLVISPWSRGGWVASETFDHTSVIRFAERLFGVREPQISDWRRSAVGDLTSALRFDEPDPTPLGSVLPGLPDTAALIAVEQQEVATLPAPQVPAVQTRPRQEPGNRPHTH